MVPHFAMEETNVTETLANARRVLNAHREWLKKKSSTVSPLDPGATEGSTTSIPSDWDQWRGSGVRLESDERAAVSTPPLSRPNTTSTPLRPHSGKVAPLELTFKKGWEGEEPQNERETREERQQQRREEGAGGRRRKRRSRGAVVPALLDSDSPEIGLTKTSLIPDVFTGSTSTFAWEKEHLPSSSTLSLQSDAIKSEIRLQETIAQIKVDASNSSQEGESDKEGKVEVEGVEEGFEIQSENSQPVKQLQSSSTGAITSVQSTPDQKRAAHSPRHSQSYIGPSDCTFLQQKSDRKDNKNDLVPSFNVTVVKPQSGVVRRNSASIPASSVVVVQPPKKKTSNVRVQPIHVVQPAKPDLPVKQSRPILHQSSMGDITLEDAEDWIPPAELISPLKSSRSSLHDNNSDISISEAMEVCPPVRYPMKRNTSDVSLEESETLLLKQNSREGGDSGLKSKKKKSNLVVPLMKKGSGIDVIEEELESLPLPCNVTDKPSKSASRQVKKHGLERQSMKETAFHEELKYDQELPEEDPRLESSLGLGIELRSPSFERKQRSAAILPPLQLKDQKTKDLTAILPPLKLKDQKTKDLTAIGTGNYLVEGEIKEVKLEEENLRERGGEMATNQRANERAEEKQTKEEEEKEDIKEGQLEQEQEEIEGMSSEVPLLRVKSISSLYTPEFKFQRKRERAPPDYHLHAQSSTLPPPCPLYGTEQPSAEKVLNGSVTHTASQSMYRAVDTPTNSRSDVDSMFGDRHSVASLRSGDESFEYYPKQEETLTLVHQRKRKEPGELHQAARAGNLRKLQALLFKGHNVDETDEKGMTPLMYCILPDGKAQLHCVDLLLRSGSNLDHQSSEGFTLLHLSAYQGIVSLMELLIMNGANPDLKDIDGRLPLHWSTHPVSVKPIDLLFKHSVSSVDVVDGSEMTLLMWSCYNRNVTVAEYLLEKGADPEEKDSEGKTAMHWACSQCGINCLRLLLTSDMTYFKDHKGCTVIHTAAESGFILGVQHILRLRAEAVHDMDKQGRTPLHYAAATNRVDVCYLLLNKGADATQKDHHGNTALEYGKMTGNEYVVALFTCHTASMADFTRRERTLRNDSRRLTSKSGDLFEECNDEVLTESLQPHDYDTVSIATTCTFASSRFTSDDECIKEASKGGYLGLIIIDSNHSNQDPPLHYYFWILSGKLYWSRSKDKRNEISAKVTKLEEGPSTLVKSRPDYSPLDLHQFTFRVWLGEKYLDLLAYSNDSYYMWTVAMRKIIDPVSETETAKVEAETETSHITSCGTETNELKPETHAETLSKTESQPPVSNEAEPKQGLELM